MKERTYFIIHGSFGNSQENWFPWLEQEIVRGGHKCINLDFPVGVGKQTYQNWEMVLDSVKRFITPDSVFFSHSISCIFLVKYCVKNNIKIGRAVFVSGFNHYLGLDEDFDEVNCTMFTNRCKEFPQLCDQRICFYSKNDPYVRLEKLQEFAKLVDAEEVVVEDAGHFNKNAGYAKFERMLNYL